jgi:hypothetical protein
MNKRTCEGCRFYESPNNDGYGFCRRNPPVGDGSDVPEVGLKDWCGEWRDKNVTFEQEERRELVRRFAVAIITRGNYRSHDEAWKYATDMANGEPNASNSSNS